MKNYIPVLVFFILVILTAVITQRITIYPDFKVGDCIDQKQKRAIENWEQAERTVIKIIKIGNKAYQYEHCRFGCPPLSKTTFDKSFFNWNYSKVDCPSYLK